MDRKVQLMNAQIEAQKELDMYEGLVSTARKTLSGINSELNVSYQPAGSRYTADELASCRRDIVGMLSTSWMHPRDITDRLHNHCADLVMREVHKLAENPRSNVMWNKRKGSASQYCRYVESC